MTSLDDVVKESVFGLPYLTTVYGNVANLTLSVYLLRISLPEI